ncbi:MAG: hypothetical protein GX891_05385 [Clostridiales bacterium]|nr:hypothetical protein [Clostridiales bacterium]
MKKAFNVLSIILLISILALSLFACKDKDDFAFEERKMAAENLADTALSLYDPAWRLNLPESERSKLDNEGQYINYSSWAKFFVNSLINSSVNTDKIVSMNGVVSSDEFKSLIEKSGNINTAQIKELFEKSNLTSKDISSLIYKYIYDAINEGAHISASAYTTLLNMAIDRSLPAQKAAEIYNAYETAKDLYDNFLQLEKEKQGILNSISGVEVEIKELIEFIFDASKTLAASPQALDLSDVDESSAIDIYNFISGAMSGVREVNQMITSKKAQLSKALLNIRNVAINLPLPENFYQSFINIIVPVSVMIDFMPIGFKVLEFAEEAINEDIVKAFIKTSKGDYCFESYGIAVSKIADNILSRYNKSDLSNELKGIADSGDELKLSVFIAFIVSFAGENAEGIDMRLLNEYLSLSLNKLFAVNSYNKNKSDSITVTVFKTTVEELAGKTFDSSKPGWFDSLIKEADNLIKERTEKAKNEIKKAIDIILNRLYSNRDAIKKLSEMQYSKDLKPELSSAYSASKIEEMLILLGMERQ